MRLNSPVTDRGREFPAEQRLISATDHRGVITSCNDEFVAIGGFERDELLGSRHDVVHHPDMPEAVCAHMWRYLKAGKAWAGIVKNRCKNGDYYWASTYVTPIFVEGRIIGYESLRVRPGAEQVRRADQLYAQIRTRSLPASGTEGFWLREPTPTAVVAGVSLLVYQWAPPLGTAFAVAGLLGIEGWGSWRRERLLQQQLDDLAGIFDSARIAVDVNVGLAGESAQTAHDMHALGERFGAEGRG